MAQPRLKDLRKAVLNERGLEYAPTHKRKRNSLTMPISSKTALMYQLEFTHRKDIADLIGKGKVRDVAAKLNINFTTISKWRRRLIPKGSADAQS